jgi:hypothetical protein
MFRSWHFVLLLSLFALLGCEGRDWPSSVFYVLNPSATSSYIVRINGEPLDKYRYHEPALEHYQASYEVYGEGQKNTVSIHDANGATLYAVELEPGSYVINATASHWVAFEEVAYGREVLPPGRRLDPSGMGVYPIGPKTSYLVFGFFALPPESISVRRRSKEAFTDREFIRLAAGSW